MNLPEDVHFCLSCCGRNWIACGREVVADCGHCGAALYPDLRASSNECPPRPHPRSLVGALPPSSPQLTRRRFWKGLRPILGLAACVWIYYLASQPTTTSQEPYGSHVASTPPSNTLPLPSPVPISQGAFWNFTNRSAMAPFEIITRGSENYYVKLVDNRTGVDAAAIYVRGDTRTEVSVPLGTYTLRYASGDIWRGPIHLFGRGEFTSFSESTSIFRFEDRGSQISGYTVELYQQTNGNMETHPISPGQF